MHEYSLVQSLLSQVEALRREHGANRVVSVHVSVGEFAGVEPELFRDAFDVQTHQLWNQGATLTMDIVPLEAECDRCKRVFHVERFHFQCGSCNTTEITVLRGEHVILENVTLEQTSEPSHQPRAATS